MVNSFTFLLTNNRTREYAISMLWNGNYRASGGMWGRIRGQVGGKSRSCSPLTPSYSLNSSMTFPKPHSHSFSPPSQNDNAIHPHKPPPLPTSKTHPSRRFGSPLRLKPHPLPLHPLDIRPSKSTRHNPPHPAMSHTGV